MTGTNTAPPAGDTGLAPPRSTRNVRLIAGSLLAGLAIAILWSAQLSDETIGVNSANAILGHNSLTIGITGSLAGIAFAFVAGFAGTFTACNVACFSALAPMMDEAPSAATRIKLAIQPLAWLAIGAIVVAGGYGAIGAAFGTHIPQLSAATTSGGFPVRVLQSVAVFSVIGLIFIYLGLAAAGVVPDPLWRLNARFRYTPQLVMGVLIGGFLIGRPYPLFFKMFQYAAATHNPLYGAVTFIVVVVGNILLMGVLFLIMSATRFQRWLQSRPGRAQRFTAAALLTGGAFTLFYWGLRVPAHFGVGWFPPVPWH